MLLTNLKQDHKFLEFLRRQVAFEIPEDAYINLEQVVSYILENFSIFDLYTEDEIFAAAAKMERAGIENEEKRLSARD